MNDSATRPFALQRARFISLCLSLVLAGLALQYSFSEKRDFSAFDLGKATSAVFADIDGMPIHLSVPAAASESNLIRAIEDSGKPPLLVLGNSQTHSINRFTAGQENVVALLHEAQQDNVYVFGHTLPNANLQELYVLYRHWADAIDLKYVVLPVFYDDTREDRLRQMLSDYAGLASEFSSGPPIENALAEQLREMAKKAVSQEAPEESSQVESPTLQDRSEAWLNTVLSEHSPTWAKRPTVRGELFIFLYRLRNTVFGITPQTQRRMLPGPYSRNLAALSAFLSDARDRGVKVLVYLPPLRQDVPPPYDLEEYSKFKKALKSLVGKYENVAFADLDSVVPGEFWGVKDSSDLSGKPEFDFMHFRFEGHELLRDALDPLIDAMVDSR